MLRHAAVVLLSAMILAGCMLLHPNRPVASVEAEAPPALAPADPAPVLSASSTTAVASSSSAAAGVPAQASAAASARESAAIAAAMKQLSQSKTDYRLAPADLISVTVYQDPDMNRKVRINTDGTVSLPLIGSISVGGRTLSEAQSAIEQKFANFLVSPQVSLFIEEYGNKTIFVMGEVQKPGSYPIPTESRMTLLEAISTAGGFTPIAAQDRARVLRNVNGASVAYSINVKEITQQGQKEKDMVLQPNDIVFIPQSFF